jgi:long-chain acyl-CoA synthetase
MGEFDPFPVLLSLIAGELAQTRRLSALDANFLGLNGDTEIGAGALGTDSLDLLNLAGAVAEMFHLHETGVEEYLLRYRTVANWSEIVQVSLQKKAEHITFRSSGSTGSPKRCTHRLARLGAEAREHAERHPDCRRVLSMIPSHHIYGFIWAALLPRHLDIPVVDVRLWSPSRIAREIQGRDLLLGVPANWSLLARGIDLFPKGVCGISSGAPCPPALFDQVRRAGVDLTEIYGSSETAGIGFRQSADEPFTLLPHWKRTDSADWLTPGQQDAESMSIPLPDYVGWESDRTFRVAGRRDGAVQVNGNNVFPGKVADVMRSCPGVRDCGVRLMRVEEGDRLKAFIVWDQEMVQPERAEDTLRRWAEQNLQPFERPATYKFGGSLPVNDMNKFADW